MVQVKCICLIRVSTQQQILEGQREKVINAAISDGYKKSEIKVVEAKESAIKLKEEQRETLNEMKQIISECPDVESIYVFAIDRIARKVSTVLSIKDWLLERKISIVFLNPHKLRTMRINDKGEKVEDELTSLMLLFLAYGAEMEMKLKQARMKVTKDLLREQNKIATGKPMLGYRKAKDKTVEVDPEWADIIRQMYIDYAYNNKTLYALYKELVAKGKMPVKKKGAGINTVRRIIENKAYYGDYSLYDKIGNIKYPPIIDKETWEVANKTRIARQNMPKINHKYIYYGKSLIKLMNTGMTMVCHSTNKCYKSFEDVKCSISVNAMDTAIWQTTKLMQMCKEMIKKEEPYNYEKEIHENEEKIENINKLLNTIKDKKQKAFRLYLSGKVDEQIYNEAINEIERDETTWTKEISKLESEIQKYIMMRNELKDSSVHNPIMLDDLDDDERKKLIDNIINRIELALQDDKSFKFAIYANDNHVQEKFNAIFGETSWEYWVSGGVMHLIKISRGERKDLSHIIVKRI